MNEHDAVAARRERTCGCQMAAAEDEVFRRIRSGVPEALDRAYQAYKGRVVAGSPADAKEFTSAQAACRAALTHVMLLLKLNQQLARSRCGGPEEETDDLDALVSEARAALEQ